MGWLVRAQIQRPGYTVGVGQDGNHQGSEAYATLLSFIKAQELTEREFVTFLAGALTAGGVGAAVFALESGFISVVNIRLLLNFGFDNAYARKFIKSLLNQSLNIILTQAQILVQGPLTRDPGFKAGFAVGVKFNKQLVKLDPSIGSSLLEEPVPSPGNIGSASVAFPSATPGGGVIATVLSPNVAIAGQLGASWTTTDVISNAEVDSFGAGNAIVQDQNGNLVGSGDVTFSRASQIPIALSGNDNYDINGQGSLSFYGAAETSLGVSGDWNATPRTLTGNVSVTVDYRQPDGQRPDTSGRDVHDHH